MGILITPVEEKRDFILPRPDEATLPTGFSTHDSDRVLCHDANLETG
jgi:hypothetical protein